jgi:tRNA-dihydrouridine synthase B
MKPLFRRFLYFQAPLEKNSDSAFRTICHRYGADYTFTEMANVGGLVRSKNTWEKLKIPDKTPTIIQLIGFRKKDFEGFLKKFKPRPGFSGFNLNAGCPSPGLTKYGMGCAMMKDVERINLVRKIFKDHPISLKLRLGANRREKEEKLYLRLIEETDFDFYIVHARHGKEKYKDRADFDIYPELGDTGKKIVANGDIYNKPQIKHLKTAGIKGAMIGRAAVHDPSIFLKLKGKKAPDIEKIKKEYETLSKKRGTKPLHYRNVSRRMGQDVKCQIEKGK